MCSITGEYTNFINFDEEEHWNINNDAPPITYYPPYILPSDAIYREDKNFLVLDDYVTGQKAKEELEEIQRRDNKVRKSK